MIATAQFVLIPAASKRSCYKCGRRQPMQQMKKRRTPSGGAVYTCQHCAPKNAKAVR